MHTMCKAYCVLSVDYYFILNKQIKNQLFCYLLSQLISSKQANEILTADMEILHQKAPESFCQLDMLYQAAQK